MPQWRRRLGRISSQPVLVDGIVLQACERFLVGVAATTGRFVWICPLDDEVVHGPAVVGTIAAVVTHSGRATLVDVRSGGQVATLAAPGLPIRRVIATREQFLFARNDGGAFSVDAATPTLEAAGHSSAEAR
jgi:hypothetical protein